MARHLPSAPPALLAAALAGLGGLAGTPSAAQEADTVPFTDATARALYEAAVDARLDWDDSLVQYTAVVRQRVAAGLRMPLKDRTLFRVESAHRVFWDRDGTTLVQVLALREQTPLGVQVGATRAGIFDQNFDPLNDRLLFGLVEEEEEGWHDPDDDFWFEHPLEPGYRDGYRFASGDTLTLTLPDGRRVRAIELRVVPTHADVHRMRGSLWIEPGSGHFVRAVYGLSDTFDAFRDIPDLRDEEDRDLRFVPGIFKPWTVELAYVAVDYSMWENGVWLPRSLRAEGTATAGILKAPATVDLSYEIEAVLTESDLAEGDDGTVEELRFRTRSEALEVLTERLVGDVPYTLEPGWSERRGPYGRRRTRYLVPEDPEWLRESPELPPPVWEEKVGFVGGEELDDLLAVLDDLPAPPARGVPRTFRWGLQRPDLVRYNRVEGLSVGARGQLRPPSPWGPLSMTATARLGVADLEPDLRAEVTHETLFRRVTWSLFHELAAVDERARHLGLGNSVTGLLFGRDDGDYYRRSGAWLTWRPPAAARQAFEVRAYAEHHRAAASETTFALWHVRDDAWSFRPNVQAEEGWEVGALLVARPWWGSDPRGVQGGFTLTLQGATGDLEYVRTAVESRLALPLFGDVRLGLEAGGGTSWGGAPPQRLWHVGGASSLRGYGPRIAVGDSYLRVRGELARHFAFGAVSLFGDGGWAGPRTAVRGRDALYSVGVGLSLVDGLIRLDGAWGVRAPKDFRLELYLDGIL